MAARQAVDAEDDVSLSGESLIEEDDDNLNKMDYEDGDQDDDEDGGGSESSFVIDLPGVPVTGSVDDLDAAEEEEQVVPPPAKKHRPVPSVSSSGDEIDEPFHGFSPSEVPKRLLIIADSADRLDLTAPFDPDLLAEVADDIIPVPPSGFVKAKVMTSPVSSLKSTPKPEPSPGMRVERPPTSVTAAAATPKPLPAPMARETREWKPSAQFYKPLAAGWVREVIYDRDASGNYCDKPKEIVYYAPQVQGTKLKQYRSLADLGSYLSSSMSEFSLNNFSFRKEPMNAPDKQEIRRAVDEVVEIFPPKAQVETPAPSLKRKSSIGDASGQLEKPSSKGSTPTSSSGLLKVKFFSRMKEKNIAANDPSLLEGQGRNPMTDDENFELMPSSKQSSVIFEKPGMKLKMAGMSQPTGLSPSVTITPTNSASLTPNSGSFIRNKTGKVGLTISSSSPTPQARRPIGGVKPSPTTMAQQHQAVKNKVLRPPIMTPVSCSIHCPMSSNVPSLSCSGCHALFHPKCVGLNEGLNYYGYDFYCFACTPPAGKENNEPQFRATPISARSKGLDASSVSSSLPSGTTLSVASGAGNSHHNSTSGVSITPTIASVATGASVLASKPKPQSAAAMRAKQPLRPLEAQTVVNIGGVKYLVVPRPAQPMPRQQVGSNGTVSHMKSDDRMQLKPVEPVSNDWPPVFEVHETADGKLLLTQLTHEQDARPLESVIKKPSEKSQMAKPVISKKYKLPERNVLSDLCLAYQGLFLTFKYLSNSDLLSVSRVCKLWRDVAMDVSLWSTLSLADCYVKDWSKLADHVSRVRSSKLDFRKMLIMPDSEEQWTTGLINIAPRLLTITHLEFQKIPSITLTNIVDIFAANENSNLTGIVVHDVSCGASKDTIETLKPLNLSSFSKLNRLEILKIRSISGTLKMENFEASLTAIADKFAHTLKSLSFLNLDSLTDDNLAAICCLEKLQILELGNCSQLSGSSIKLLATLSQLERLRLERGHIGEDIGHLGHLERFQKLELIDFELHLGFGNGFVKLKALKQILLIPTFKNDVGQINAEVIDSASTLANVSHLFFGLTNEWLETTENNSDGTKGGLVPILIKGKVESLTLSRLSKMFVTALPHAKRVKILKMSKKATTKQYLSNMKLS